MEVQLNKFKLNRTWPLGVCLFAASNRIQKIINKPTHLSWRLPVFTENHVRMVLKDGLRERFLNASGHEAK